MDVCSARFARIESTPPAASDAASPQLSPAEARRHLAELERRLEALAESRSAPDATARDRVLTARIASAIAQRPPPRRRRGLAWMPPLLVASAAALGAWRGGVEGAAVAMLAAAGFAAAVAPRELVRSLSLIGRSRTSSLLALRIIGAAALIAGAGGLGVWLW